MRCRELLALLGLLTLCEGERKRCKRLSKLVSARLLQRPSERFKNEVKMMFCFQVFSHLNSAAADRQLSEEKEQII